MLWRTNSINSNFYRLIAQLAEPLALNQAVVGSNPTEPIHISFGLVAQWSEQSAHNRLVAGSNPAEPTKLFQNNP